MKKLKQAPIKVPLWFNLLGLCLWVLISVLAVQFIVSNIMFRILGAESFKRPVWIAAYSAITYVVAMILILFVPLALKRKKAEKTEIKDLRNDIGLKDLPTWTDIGLAPVGFIVSLILAALLVSLFGLIFPWFNAEEAQNLGFSTYDTSANRIIAFFTLIVIAPIAEEIIFRGFLYGKLRERLSEKVSEKIGILIATFLTSLFFGIAHLQWNVGVNVFALSLVLCALREITGSIYAGILTHMIKNGVAFYLLYVVGVV